MVATETFANLPQTTVTSGGTTAPAPLTSENWTVQSTASFPAAATGVTQFRVIDVALQSEVILVTNVSGTSWTVTRGAESTTPVSHAAGFTIRQAVTAGVLGAFSQGASMSNPMTTLGDMIYENATPAAARLAGSTSARRKALTQTGNGSVSAAPAWQEPATAWVNAVDSGADPTGGSASDTALAALLTAAAGKTAYLPAGTYLLSGASALAMSTAGTRLTGDGPGVTILQPGSAFTAAEVIAITANSCTVDNLSIVGANTGNSALGGSAGWNGIEITAAQHCSVHDMFFQFVNGYAIESIGTSGTANVDTQVRSVVHRNCAAGIHVKGNTTTSFNGQHFLTDIQGQQVGTTTGANPNLDAWLIEDIHDVAIVSPNVGVTAGTGHAMHIRGAAAGVFVTNADLGGGSDVVLIEDNGGNSPTQVRFTGGNIQSSTAGAGLHGTGAGSDWTFSNIMFRNNQGDGCTLANTGTLACALTGCKWNVNNQANGTAYDLNFASATTKWQVNGGVFLTAVGSGAGLVTHPVNDPTPIGTFTGTQFLGTSTTTGNVFVSSAAAWLGLTVGSTTGWSHADATAANISADGTQSAGSNHLLADSGHVHPADVFVVADHGFLAATYDPSHANSTTTITAGTVYLAKIWARTSFTASNIWVAVVVTPGSGASTQSFVGLYNSSGTLLSGSSDIGSSLTSLGAKSLALTTPQSLTAGNFYWAAIVTNLATTQPTLARIGSSSQAFNANLAAASFRFAVNGTLATSLVNITPSSNTATGSIALWVGIT